LSKISVIVPVYKAEQHLEKCTESILKQTFTDIELILVDDGSPDNCPQLCDKIALGDKRVKVIHQKNAGVSAARNAGLDRASGSYIAFVDSDDYLELDMYERMMRIASKYDCDLVMCDCIKEFEGKAEVYTHPIRDGLYNREQLEKEYFHHLLIMPDMEYPPTISNWLCLFKNQASLGGNLRYEVGVRYSEDLFFGAQLIYNSNTFYYMKGCGLYHYNCTNLFSATRNPSPDKWKDYVHLHESICSYFGNLVEYDFSEQIDKVLLFFVYNAVGDFVGNNRTEKKADIMQIRAILNTAIVKQMFKRLKVYKLPVPFKLKIMTLCYKYKFGLGFLYDYLGRK